MNPNSAFTFDPNAMNAFSFNFADGGVPGAVPGANFGVNTSAFDFSGAAVGNMGPMFHHGAPMPMMTGPPPSLFEMANHSSDQPQQVQQVVSTPQKPDPFAALSIEGIKTGFDVPVATIAPQPRPTPPVSSQSGSSHQFTASTPLKSATPVAPEPQIEVVSKPKTADQFLSSIDLNGPPQEQLVEKPAPKASTPYSNEGLVKTKIDWAKQRDQMAAFLAPKVEPEVTPTPQEVPKSAVTEEDWGEFDDGGVQGDDQNWSDFGSAPAPSTAPQEALHENPTIIQSPIPSHPTTNAHAALHTQPQTGSLETSISSTTDTGPSTTPAAMVFDPSAFDTSAFDTSAFNFSADGIGGAFTSNSTNPTTAAFDTDTSAFSTDVSAFTGTNSSNDRPHTPVEQASVAPTEKSSSTLKEDDFSSFTSTGADGDDWSAFEGDDQAEKDSSTEDMRASSSSLGVPSSGKAALMRPPSPGSSSILAPPSPIETAASLPKRKSEAKIWDISSFELPATPTKSADPHLNSLVPPSAQAKQDEPNSTSLFSPSFSSSLVDDETSNNSFVSATSTNNSWGDLFSMTPSWMNSNRSEDSTSSIGDFGVTLSPGTPQDSPSTPTSAPSMPDFRISLDPLKKELVSLIGNDKAAPFMWIFDNMGKSIAISLTERCSLATELIEDLKSQKLILLSSVRVNQWHSLLTKCNEDILRATSYLSNVVVQAEEVQDSELAEVMRRYLSHERTLSYLSGVSKIYRVALRISASVHSNTGVHATSQTPKTSCRYVKPSLLKAISTLESTIQNSWEALQTQIESMEEESGGNSDDSPAMRALLTSKPVPHAPMDFNCSLCYRGFDEYEGPASWNDKKCHASCANYWTHRISSKPPAL